MKHNMKEVFQKNLIVETGIEWVEIEKKRKKGFQKTCFLFLKLIWLRIQMCIEEG